MHQTASVTGAPSGASVSIPGSSATGRLKSVLLNAVGPDLYASARSIYQMWRRDRHSPFPLTSKVRAWRHGFQAESAALYDFPRNDPRDYVSEYQRSYRCSKINPENDIFRLKLMWRSFMLNMGFPQAETVAVVTAHDILMHPFSDRRRYVSYGEFERLLAEDGGRFIVKPEGGERGVGVLALQARDGVLLSQHGPEARPIRRADYGRLAIVERMLVPHQFWRDLFPQSTNTIRALTLWTPGDELPFLARAVQRVGTRATMPTDNWSGGGVCAPIDLATGRLGKARIHPLAASGSREPFTHHPDSGARIEGGVLPHWDAVRETVLRAATTLPVNRYIGWDVLVDESGAPVIIEANGNTGLQMVQVESGLLTDPAIRRFYERCGVV
jgi:hypothetical protein